MTASMPLSTERIERVELVHGAGGRAMTRLVQELMAPAFDNPWLQRGDDGAVLPPINGRLVMATDSHVVSPRFFPGGDIGCLAVHGTVNDLAAMGARPCWMAVGLILEEGLPLDELRRIIDSLAQAARSAGIAVVTGDTKVVPRGQADGIYISTTGVGCLAEGIDPSGRHARPGDAVLVSGPVGDHGMAILALREGLELQPPVLSDTAALHGLVAELLAAVPDVHVLRDPTRGGLSATLNEICQQSGVGMSLQESAIPVRRGVATACELLGLDPLDLACEGRMLVICAPEQADRALQALQGHPLGQGAARIGEVVADPHRFVRLQTRFGGQRLLQWLSGDPLPRIC